MRVRMGMLSKRVNPPSDFPGPIRKSERFILEQDLESNAQHWAKACSGAFFLDGWTANDR